VRGGGGVGGEHEVLANEEGVEADGAELPPKSSWVRKADSLTARQSSGMCSIRS